MKFLIDGHRSRVQFRAQQWPDGVLGQLLTPLTRYSRGPTPYAIDNGAFTSFREKNFYSLLNRERQSEKDCLFVAVPDKVGDHAHTLALWNHYSPSLKGLPLAFVAQEGYDGMPEGAVALFIGGTNKFKDSIDALVAVDIALKQGKHVHIGRVNTLDRFKRFRDAGAHTCDGSGVSRYDHMILDIRRYYTGA